jgi:uncharacterized membrane protein
VNSVDVETTVYLPREEVFEFLLDFPGYATYSKYLQDVQQIGDGPVGTEYALHFAWWKLSYTAHSQVTDTDPPERIDWRLLKDIDANGAWVVEPTTPPPAEREASRVRLLVEYDPDSVRGRYLDLPRFISIDTVIEKTKPLIEREAARVVRRAVADLEGRQREVDLTIRTDGDR